MKLTVRAKKLIALFLMVSIVLPLTSSFGVWDSMVDSAYATGTGSGGTEGSNTEEGTVDPGAVDPDGDGENSLDMTVDEYRFYSNADVDMYDYDISFTYNGTEYNGLFKNELKFGNVDNTSLGLDSLGTMKDPYVIMEIAPNVAKTEIRAFVKDSGVYSLTQAEKKAIVLTEEEINEIREDTREYLFYKQFGKTYASLSYTWMTPSADFFNGDPDFADFFERFPIYPPNYGSIVDVYDEMMQYFEERLDGFDAEFKKRKEIALQKKIEKEESDRVRNEYGGASFGSAYQYELKYKVVEDPKNKGSYIFDSYTSAGTKKSLLGTGMETNALPGEYKLEFGDYNSSIYCHSNLFIKGCLDLAYETHIEDGVIVDEQKAYIDEYIFAGWYYMDEYGSPQHVESDTDLKKLGVKDLYTYWTARPYASSQSYQVGTGGADDIVIDFGESSYSIHLPATLASRKTAQEPWNDPKNQISFFKLDTYVGVNWNESKSWAGDSSPINLQDEISAWNMTFGLDEYKTGAELLKVAPKLMADTDYYIATYNVNVVLDDETGERVVEYYPYNVQVITVTPEDLNKMVYYDYAVNGWSADEYHSEQECTYISKFLNDVDLIYITNGNNVTFGKDNDHPVCQERFPTLFTEDGTYLSDKVNFSTKLQNDSVPDIEWQAIMKIYTRALDDTQKRRISTVFDRTTYSAVANIDSGRTESNLDKLTMLWFMAVEPSFIYRCYVINDEEMAKYNFDKLKGTTREEAYRTTNYTGRLYDQVKWGGRLFFPYEAIGIDHYQASISNEKLGTLFPWGNDINLMYEYFKSVGLAYNFQPTTIVNNYARSFIGGNNLGQGFAVKDITEQISDVNNSNDNNTGLMFDYFNKVRPDAIVNGMLSTENAIEFMVQNVRNKIINAYDRRITVLNKVDPPEKFGTLKVDKVIADFSMPTEWVQYNFTTSVGGYYVAEYYWTPKFQDVDNDNVFCGAKFIQYTTSTDPDIRWVKLPNSDLNKIYYKTFTSVADADGNIVAGEEIKGRISSDGVPYQFEGEVQPVISYTNTDSSKVNITGAKGHFVIVVQKYKSEKSYLEGEAPLRDGMTMKNVTLEKMTHLFNLD